VNGLRGFDIGSGHPEKMAAKPSNVLWRLRHNTAKFHIAAKRRYVPVADMAGRVATCAAKRLIFPTLVLSCP
jgi:hypothetical protein